MDKRYDIAILIGNLQQESPNRKLAGALAALSSSDMNLQIVEIGNLPLYNEDDEHKPPAVWREFRNRIKAASAVIFVTPEHLRSVPAVLINALDVGSMPADESVWETKPAAIMGVSTGMVGPFNNHAHLRDALSVLKMQTLAEPRIYLAGGETIFDETGKLIDPGTQTMLAKFLETFAAWIADRNSQ